MKQPRLLTHESTAQTSNVTGGETTNNKYIKNPLTQAATAAVLCSGTHWCVHTHRDMLALLSQFSTSLLTPFTYTVLLCKQTQAHTS